MLKRFRVEENSEKNDVIRVPVETMRKATEAIFRVCGLTQSSASICTDVLISNDLRGNDSHGVSNMLRKYTEWYLGGNQNPRPYVKIVNGDSETSAVSIIDGDGALGIHVGPMAMKLAIEKAKKFGMGCVIVKNAGHLGGAGYHASLAAKEGCIGQCFGAPGGGLICPTFGAEPRFGTHPMSWAAPGGPNEADFLFDVATSQVAANKLRLAARLGVPIAENWITDENGKVIETEVDKIPDKFYMTPMGGTRENSSHKGYGLACVIDILCNTLSGIGAGFLTGGGGLLFQAYDIASFCDIKEYGEWMDKFLYGLKTTPPVPEYHEESDRVLYPGLYAHEVSEERLKNGIPYHKEVLFWYKCFADQMKSHPNHQEDEVQTLISLINEFPSYDITEDEQKQWQSLLSGVLGNSSMSHGGSLKDQSGGKWKGGSKSNLKLMDGSMGRLLCINGLPHGEGTLFKKIWAAAALADPKYHELIVKAHMEYILAGSQIICTNSYGTQPNYYAEAYGQDKYKSLMLEHAKISAELAVKARNECAFDNDVKVFGVLGPICESHQPGVTKKYIEEKGEQFCIDIYAQLAKALYDGGVDGLLLESINNWEEAKVALDGVKHFKKTLNEKAGFLPIYLSMEGAFRNNERQPDPEKLASIYAKQFFEYYDANPTLGLKCFGLNCASPEATLDSLNFLFNDGFEDELKRRQLGFCIYANLNDRKAVHSGGFDRSKDNAEAIKMRSDLVSDGHEGHNKAIEEMITRFKAITHIGGCCGCKPDGIKSLQRKFL